LDLARLIRFVMSADSLCYAPDGKSRDNVLTQLSTAVCEQPTNPDLHLSACAVMARLATGALAI